MSGELLGGETIRIDHLASRLHTFMRTMPKEREKHLDSANTSHIDPWVLVDPMSAQQAAKVSARQAPTVVRVRQPREPDLTPECEAMWDAAERQKGLDWINTRRRSAIEIQSWADDDGSQVREEWYVLGAGIPLIRTWKMWDILDGLAESALAGQLPAGARVQGDILVVGADTLAQIISRTL